MRELIRKGAELKERGDQLRGALARCQDQLEQLLPHAARLLEAQDALDPLNPACIMAAPDLLPASLGLWPAQSVGLARVCF